MEKWWKVVNKVKIENAEENSILFACEREIELNVYLSVGKRYWEFFVRISSDRESVLCSLLELLSRLRLISYSLWTLLCWFRCKETAISHPLRVADRGTCSYLIVALRWSFDQNVKRCFTNSIFIIVKTQGWQPSKVCLCLLVEIEIIPSKHVHIVVCHWSYDPIHFHFRDWWLMNLRAVTN